MLRKKPTYKFIDGSVFQPLSYYVDSKDYLYPHRACLRSSMTEFFMYQSHLGRYDFSKNINIHEIIEKMITSTYCFNLPPFFWTWKTNVFTGLISRISDHSVSINSRFRPISLFVHFQWWLYFSHPGNTINILYCGISLAVIFSEDL